MNFLKEVFKSYISSSIHVAIAAFSLTKITLLGAHIFENTIPLFNFFATILSYNFIKYYQTHDLTFSNWVRSQKKNLTPICWISIVFLIYLTSKIELAALFSLIPFFLATVFYVVPLSSNRSNLRNIATLKLFLIAISWTGVTVIFPLINYELPFHKDVILQIIQIFLFIIGVAIPFDIRDMLHDNPKIRTLPQIIGLRRSKFIGISVLLLFFIIEFFKEETSSSEKIIKLIIMVISMVLLVFANDRQPKYYSSFWVESIPIIWLLLLISTK